MKHISITIPFLLKEPTTRKKKIIGEGMKQFAWVMEQVFNRMPSLKPKTRKYMRNVTSRWYKEFQKDDVDLQSSIVQQAIEKARSSWLDKDEVHTAHVKKGRIIRFHSKTYKILEKDGSFFVEMRIFKPLKNFVNTPLELFNADSKNPNWVILPIRAGGPMKNKLRAIMMEQDKPLSEQKYKRCDGAELILYPNGVYSFNIPVKIPAPPLLENDPNRNLTFGVDMGEKRIAATCGWDGEERKHGHIFGKGKYVLDRKRKYKERKKSLQKTSSDRGEETRRLKKLGNKEGRFKRTHDHEVSRHTVDWVFDHNGHTMVLENLHQFQKHNSLWTFYRLRQYIAYKAKMAGIKVILINPRNTSKRCSRCGNINDEVGEEFFVCKKCGFQVQRDINAAANLAQYKEWYKGEVKIL